MVRSNPSPAFLLAALAFSLPPPAFAESTQAIRMRVVEAGSGKPIAGAQVRYSAMAREGTFTGHGGRYAAMFDITTETDAQGTINIAPTSFSPRIFGLFGMNTNYENAQMTIERSGYETLELRNQARIIPNLSEVIAWEHNGKTVELKPASAQARKPAPPVFHPGPPPVRRADDRLPQHHAAPVEALPAPARLPPKP